MSETSKLLPCPFCGSDDVDAEFWASTSSAAKDPKKVTKGPGCMKCNATAETVERWNTRCAS